MTRREPLSFGQLLEPIRAAGLLAEVVGDLSTPIEALAHDSRAVEPGTCFFALRGVQADGHLFLDKAVHHGAVAAVCERLPEGAPRALPAWALVTDSRAALAEAAADYFGRPSQTLRLVGVTGTNGKTTTTFLLHHALLALGETAGLLGTVDTRIGSRTIPATHTTPDALALNELLAEMVEAGCTACAMEVSSHALAQHRVRGQRFAVAAFTNLTHDHLDYHETFDAYRATKAQLFAGLDASATAVVNRDDGAWPFMVKGTLARVVTYGQGAPAPAVGHRLPDVDADIAFSIEENTLAGLRLRLDGQTRSFRLAGLFNAYNLAAAYGVLRALGYGQAEALDALTDAPPVPGRLETIRPADAGVDGPGPVAVVDYAHTPDALENVLRTVRETMTPGGRLTVVFGCGGDRDRSKRPAMGHIAGVLADRVVLTNDNPRSEEPAAILRAIAEGMAAPPAAVTEDRAEAIREALASAGPADAVVIAGKGHEPYQIIGADTRPFDDRDEVRKAFADRIFRRD